MGDAKWKKSELVVVAAPGPINPLKAALGLSVIHSMPGAQCFFFFFFLFLFKDVEKKMELKSPKLHTPREVGTCHPPPHKNLGISILRTPTSPNHVAEAGARVSLP